GGRGGGQWSTRPAHYPELQKKNDTLEKYYDELGIVPLDERDEFWECLRRELPNSFRFCGSKGHALAVQERLINHYIPQITSVEYNEELVDPPKQIEWFPGKLAWQMTTPKNVVRKFPPFRSFQNFLVSETAVGNISRQEIVSMVPPLFMDIKPGMTVLDMCAAPGSKTAQLIEMIHGGEEARARKVLKNIAKQEGRELSPDGMEIELEKEEAETEDDYSDDGRSTGLLVANDVEYRRAQMLVHQVKRLNSPNIVVMNHDATMFPSIKIVQGSDGRPGRYLKFDRILADVPCSGDGTARKNPNIWKDWVPGNGIGLHTIQVRILVRALQMLKVGGRVVYSTCSLNPIENEAVVASAIERCGGTEKVQIIDCSKDIAGLQRRPGMQSWKVMDRNLKFWTWDELDRARESTVPEGAEKLTESHFPPSEDQQIRLERCMRVYPHLQDTGGFFICVLEKQTEIRAKPENETKKAQPSSVASPILKRKVEDDPETGEPVKKFKFEDPRMEHFPPPPSVQLLENGEANGQVSTAHEFVSKKKSNQPYEEPFKYLDPSNPVLEDIFKFYQLPERFPRDRFMVRNADGLPVKAIYYTAVLPRTILQLNEGKGMKFVHGGVKMFVKQDAQGQDICRWRIQSEGLPIIEGWVGEERVVRCWKRTTLHKMLKEMFPKVAQDGWKDLGEIGDPVRDLGMGCCVLRVERSDEEDGFKERMALPMWKSMASVNLMMPKEERKAMLLRLFNDSSELIDHS
ncbi:S-adenosyl-L-methionine-dependent methyltransferase, partial [Rhizodiscina lignyota]